MDVNWSKLKHWILGTFTLTLIAFISFTSPVFTAEISFPQVTPEPKPLQILGPAGERSRMVVVTGRFTVRPERKEEVIQLALSMFDPSRAEVGCISYNFYEDASRENSFLFLEEWKSQEAIAEHFQTKHFHEFMQKFPSLIVGTPDIKIYEIGGVKQL